MTTQISALNLLIFTLAMDEEHPALAHVVEWVNEIAQRGSKVFVITTRKGKLNRLKENVEVFSVGGELKLSKLEKTKNFFKFLFKILNKEKINGVFALMNPIFLAMSGPILKKKKIRTLLWFTHPSLTTWLKVAHFFADCIFTTTEYSYPYKKNKVRVTGHGINISLFRPLNEIEKSIDVLYVGRISPVKDLETFVKSIAILQNTYNKQVIAKIVGSPLSESDKNYLEKVKSLTKQLELEKIILYEPAKPRYDLVKVYNQSKIHVNLTPSGFGDKVVLESMACGVVNVVANEGFKDIFTPYDKMLLFEYGKPESLAYCLNRILGLSTEKRTEIGLYLRKKIQEVHSLERLVDQIITYFVETHKA